MAGFYDDTMFPPPTLMQVLSKLSTPRKLDPHVKRFCRSLSTENPEFISVSAEPWCRQSNCEMNVEKLIGQIGGKKVYGYKIWYTVNTYVEAERHVVLKTVDGLRDPTFNSDGETIVLFVPDADQSRGYDSRPLRLRRGISLAGKRITDFVNFGEAQMPFSQMSKQESWDSMITYEAWLAGQRQANITPTFVNE